MSTESKLTGTPNGGLKPRIICNGCGHPLLLENLLCEDGCPCNTPRGINYPPEDCALCKEPCTRPGHHLKNVVGFDPYSAALASPPTPAVDENADRPTLMFWMIEAHHERMPGPHPRWLKNRNTQETTQNAADAIKWQNAFSAEVERQQLRGIGGDVSHNFIVTEHSYLEPPK